LDRVDKQLASIKSTGSTWLDEMVIYSLQNRGKRIRPALTLLSGKLYNYQLDSLMPMASAIELMHTATLVHDDTIDKSPTRRGKSTVYWVWGEAKAILVGDFLFARAGEMATDTENLMAVRIFTQTLAIISTGEVNQSMSSFDLKQTRENYLERIAKKTASLFALSTESGGLLSQAPETAVRALRDYGYHLGIAFQIIDDILDYTSTEKLIGKPIGSDLMQGTLTLPSMMILERYPKDNPVRRFFEKRDELTKEEKTGYILQARDMVCNSTIAEECRRAASEYSRIARNHLESLPEGTTRRALAELSTFILKRDE